MQLLVSRESWHIMFLGHLALKLFTKWDVAVFDVTSSESAIQFYMSAFTAVHVLLLQFLVVFK